MATRNILLTDSLQKVVNDLVIFGRYQNASEVLRYGLRLLERREAEEAAKLEALKHATPIGIMDLEKGRFVQVTGDDLDDLFAEIGQKAADAAGEMH